MQLKNKIENKLKIIEKDKIVCLDHKMDELFEMYPKSFNNQGKALLKMLERNEKKVNYKYLS